MASTNKTTNYNLSQYINSDKPTYLGDYNSDMLKIDTQMKNNNDIAVSANGVAQTAQTTANKAQSTADTANATANQANTTAGNAQTSANQALDLINNFNLTDFTNIAFNDITTNNGSVNNTSHITIATNNDKTIGKIYGTVSINTTNHQGNNISLSFQTNLRPTEQITINNAILFRDIDSNNAQSISFDDLIINPNGLVQTSNHIMSNNSVQNAFFILPFLYWFKNFGDTPDNVS